MYINGHWRNLFPSVNWRRDVIGEPITRILFPSANEEKSEEQTVKIWAKSANPFKSYEFSKFMITALMGIRAVGGIEGICDVMVVQLSIHSVHQIAHFLLLQKSNKN